MQLSQPYIFTVKSTLPNAVQVQLFGANVNREANNFGNPAGITIEYDLDPRGRSGYTNLLGYSMTTPVRIGLMRANCQNQQQLDLVGTATINNPTGASSGSPSVFFRKLDQVIQNAVEWSGEFGMNGNTVFRYQHLPMTEIQFMLWPTRIATLTPGR